MKKYIHKTVGGLMVVAVLAVSTVLTVGLSVSAEAPTKINASDKISSGVNAAGGEDQAIQPQIEQIINVLLFLIGAIAVIMIIIGGIKYVLSNGESAQITSAKNTILYAVIGLVVALLAYAIVNFVVAQFAR